MEPRQLEVHNFKAASFLGLQYSYTVVCTAGTRMVTIGPPRPLVLKHENPELE